MKTFRHRITPAEFARATQLATDTLALFQNRPGYYTNNLNSHLRGKLGEIAATSALRSLGLSVDETWADLARLSEADIQIPGGFRADVKTWNRNYWAKMGRCVAVSQFQALERKADVIIWCSSDSRLEVEMTIEVMGWNSLSDVAVAPRRLTGPAQGRNVDNYQLDESALRELSLLLNFHLN